MLSPSHFYGDDEKNGPQYILIITTDMEIALIEPMYKLDPEFIQNTLIEFYKEVPMTPERWVTRGVFAPFLKECLDPVMEIFKIPFTISTEESVVDMYSHEELFHLITSDDPYYDFDDLDDFDDFDGFNLSEELRERRDFHESSKKASSLESELEELQSALSMALEYISNKQTITTDKLKKFLQEKNIRPLNISAVIEGLIESGCLLPDSK